MNLSAVLIVSALMVLVLWLAAVAVVSAVEAAWLAESLVLAAAVRA